MTRESMRENVKAKAHEAAEERVIEAIAGEGARDATREMFRKKLKDGLLDDTVIELELQDTSSPFPMMDIPGQPGMGASGAPGKNKPRSCARSYRAWRRACHPSS